ncbi:uncharacterized protein V6R79_023048 [Siganus canaliculatus]
MAGGGPRVRLGVARRGAACVRGKKKKKKKKKLRLLCLCCFCFKDGRRRRPQRSVCGNSRNKKQQKQLASGAVATGVYRTENISDVCRREDEQKLQKPVNRDERPLSAVFSGGLNEQRLTALKRRRIVLVEVELSHEASDNRPSQDSSSCSSASGLENPPVLEAD